MYTFFRDGIKEEVNRERWRWEAVYEDKTIKQFDDSDMSFHQIKELENISEPFLFRMVHDTLPAVNLFIKEGAELFHYYRNTVLNSSTPQERVARWYCFGYVFEKQSIEMAILDNDELIITDNIESIKLFNE